MEQKLREVGGPIRVPSGTAPGYRDAGYFNAPGRLSGVGNNGFGWSSATSGIYGLHLSFYVTWPTRRIYYIAATVFSCVASRNKRGCVPVGARGWSYPNCVLSASLRFEEPQGPEPPQA